MSPLIYLTVDHHKVFAQFQNLFRRGKLRLQSWNKVANHKIYTVATYSWNLKLAGHLLPVVCSATNRLRSAMVFLWCIFKGLDDLVFLSFFVCLFVSQRQQKNKLRDLAPKSKVLRCRHRHALCRGMAHFIGGDTFHEGGGLTYLVDGWQGVASMGVGGCKQKVTDKHFPGGPFIFPNFKGIEEN